MHEPSSYGDWGIGEWTAHYQTGAAGAAKPCCDDCAHNKPCGGTPCGGGTSTGNLPPGEYAPGQPPYQYFARQHGAGQEVGSDAVGINLIVHVDEVQAAKRALDAKWQSVLIDVQNCAALSDEERQGFTAAYKAWQYFFNQPISPVFTRHVLDEVGTYDRKLYDWQEVLKKKCTMSAPVIKPETDEEKILKLLREGGHVVTGQQDMVKTVAIAAGVIAVAIFVGPALLEMVKGAGK